MSRKLYSIKNHTSVEGFFFPGSDVPDYVQYIENVDEKFSIGKIFVDPNFDMTDVRNLAQACIGETVDRVYYSCREEVDITNHGEPVEDLDFQQEQFPLSAEVSAEIIPEYFITTYSKEVLEDLGFSFPESETVTDLTGEE